MAELDFVMTIIYYFGIGMGMLIPWILLLVAVTLNKNVWLEIKAIFDKKSVRIIEGVSNNQLIQYFRKPSKDGRILLHKATSGDDKSQDEHLIPSQRPHFETGNRLVYLVRQGSDDNINLLEQDSQVTTPMKQMAITMAFAEGRKYERKVNPMSNPNIQIFVLFGVLIVALLIVAGMTWASNSMLQAITDSMGIQV